MPKKPRSTPDPMDISPFVLGGSTLRPEYEDPYKGKRQWQIDMDEHGHQLSPEEIAKNKAEAKTKRKREFKELLEYLHTVMPLQYKALHLEYMGTVTPDNEPLHKATKAEIHFGTKGPYRPSVVMVPITREVNLKRPGKFHQWEIGTWTEGNDLESESTLPTFSTFYNEGHKLTHYTKTPQSAICPGCPKSSACPNCPNVIPAIADAVGMKYILSDVFPYAIGKNREGDIMRINVEDGNIVITRNNSILGTLSLKNWESLIPQLKDEVVSDGD